MKVTVELLNLPASDATTVRDAMDEVIEVLAARGYTPGEADRTGRVLIGDGHPAFAIKFRIVEG